MDITAGERQERRVRIHTVRGSLEGLLPTNAQVRTLDDLNVVARHFVTLLRAGKASGEWALEGGLLAVAKTAILFVIELDEPARRPFGCRARP